MIYRVSFSDGRFRTWEVLAEEAAEWKALGHTVVELSEEQTVEYRKHLAADKQWQNLFLQLDNKNFKGS